MMITKEDPLPIDAKSKHSGDKLFALVRIALGGNAQAIGNSGLRVTIAVSTAHRIFGKTRQCHGFVNAGPGAAANPVNVANLDSTGFQHISDRSVRKDLHQLLTDEPLFVGGCNKLTVTD